MAYHGKLLKDMTPGQRIKRIAALKAAGADTSKLPSSYLSPADQQKRLLAQRLAAPIVDGSSITNRDLKYQTDAATNLQFGATDAQLAQQAQQTQAQIGRNQQWYDGYLQTVKDAEGRQAQNQAALAAQVQGMNQAAQTSSIQGAQALQGQMQADAASRGATLDPSVGQNAAQAASVRRAVQDSYGAQLVGAQGDQTSFLNALGLVAKQQGGERLTADQAAAAKVRQDMATVAGQKGSFKTKFIQDTKSAEAKAVNDAALTAAATGQKTAAQKAAAQKTENDFIAKHGVSSAAYRAMSPAQRAANDKRFKAGSTPDKPAKAPNDDAYLTKYGITKAAFLALSPAERKKLIASTKKNGAKPPKPTTGPGSVSPTLEAKRVSSVQSVLQFFQNGKVNGKPASPAQIQDYLQHRRGGGLKTVDARVVHVARSLFENGGQLGPDGVKSAHALGIHVGGRYSILKHPKAGAGGGTAVVGGGV